MGKKTPSQPAPMTMGMAQAAIRDERGQRTANQENPYFGDLNSIERGLGGAFATSAPAPVPAARSAHSPAPHSPHSGSSAWNPYGDALLAQQSMYQEQLDRQADIIKQNNEARRAAYKKQATEYVDDIIKHDQSRTATLGMEYSGTTIGGPGYKEWVKKELKKLLSGNRKAEKKTQVKKTSTPTMPKPKEEEELLGQATLLGG